MTPRIGIYMHFPWCLKKCPYCDFVSYKKAANEIDHAGYADAVIREANARAPFVDGEIETIFFGGGTPSLWDPRELGRSLAHLSKLFHLSSNAEITVECNPTSLDLERATALRTAGVNRLSIGTQSLRESELKFLGRLHDAGGAIAAIRAAQEAGFERLSTDLIFGLPAQETTDAVAQAMSLADLGLTHLSCYQLTIEPGTQFGELAKIGRLPLADDGRVADSFLAIDDALTARGFRHYEISNYAMPGEESLHNLGYWIGREYLGLGTGAVGRLGSVRYRNEIDPEKYMQLTNTVSSQVLGEGDGLSTFSETLDGETLLRERIMLGLRLESGFDLAKSAAEVGAIPWPTDRKREVERLVAKNRLVREGDHLRIPRHAWLYANDTAARVF